MSERASTSCPRACSGERYWAVPMTATTATTATSTAAATDAAAQDLLAYIDASPTPYHAVAETRRRLVAKGYRPLDEREAWELKAGDKVFVTRGDTTIAAFHLGTQPVEDIGIEGDAADEEPSGDDCTSPPDEVTELIEAEGTA